MGRRQVLVLVAGAAVLLGTGCGQAAAVRAVASWSRAIEVPGLRVLNKDGNAGVLSVSCPSPGYCAAVGFYRDGGGHWQGFVAGERKGRWGQAIEVPGLAALNKRRNAEVSSVSCAAPGYCTAGGYYGSHGSSPDVITSGHGFVVSERNGHWGQAVKVPGLVALNKGENAEVSSVSCASPGNCAAGGSYADSDHYQQGFVVSETNGVWGQAIEVPGLAALSQGGDVDFPGGVNSVSCPSPGNCAAGGDYYASGDQHAFVVSEQNGNWGTAQEVAGNVGGSVGTVSCGSAGNCAAGGFYSASGGQQAFVVSEVNGIWAPAQEVAGSLNIGDFGWVASVSCGSAGNCSAGGAYDYGGYNAPFVVSEKNGVWGQAIGVPHLVTRDAWVSSVSCASAGNCGAGGGYDGAGSGAFVVSEKNGVWAKGIKVPGPGGLPADVSSVSCSPAGSCVAAGSYEQADRHYHVQGFVT